MVKNLFEDGAPLNEQKGDCHTPQQLLRTLQYDIAIIIEAFPRLTQKFQKKSCLDFNLNEPFHIPLSRELTGDPGDTARDAVTSSLRVVCDFIQAFVKDTENRQTQRIQAVYEIFLNRFSVASVQEVPTLLKELMSGLEEVERIDAAHRS